MENEIWKPIMNFEENYEVSNFGQIKNKKTGHILKGDYNNIGYRRVILSNGNETKRYFVHRLVAMHFCEGYSEELVVNHKDGNKLNNNADNLEWVTRSENDLHAYRNNLRHVHHPGKQGDAFYQVFDLSSGALIKEYDGQKELREEYNLSNMTIQASVKRGWFFKDWHHKALGKLGIKVIFY